LAEGGADTVLVEAQTAGFGASGRNNGQVIPAYTRHNPDDVVREFGVDQGERMNAWVAGSAELVFELIRRHGIDCDAAQEGWLQPAHADSRLVGLQAKHDQWAARGAPVEMIDRDTMAALTGSPIYRGGWMHRGGGHIQPLSYARGLAHAAIEAGAAVHSESPALELRRDGTGWRVITPAGEVAADTVLLATNAYTDQLWPGLSRSIVPVRSFHIACRTHGRRCGLSAWTGKTGLSRHACRSRRSVRGVYCGAPPSSVCGRPIRKCPKPHSITFGTARSR
jgi:glycine/D-amino acid oxidase-like deaminating enzyme